MTFLGKSNSEILVAGSQNVMFKIDVERGRIIEKVRVDHALVWFRLLIVDRFPQVPSTR